VAENLLALRDILVRYGDKTALKIPRLEIKSGEALALLGPNGAGKTTLLKVMGLLQSPDTGEVYFNGAKAGASNALAIRRRIAMVFQEPLLLNASVFQNAALGLRLRGYAGHQIETRLVPWLERLGISHLSAHSGRSLSGGEAQRTSLARALAVGPELLLLDEPFSALDPTSREVLLRDFQRIMKDTGITTVFVTHDRAEAFTLAARVGVMQNGHLAQLGSRESVFMKPNSRTVAEIVGVENCLRGVVEGVDGNYTVIATHGVRVFVSQRFEVGIKVVICIRAEDIHLRGEGCEAENPNRFKGKIIEVASGIARHRIVLDCGPCRFVALLGRKESLDVLPCEGEEVTVLFSPAAVHVVEDGADGCD
jgi:tungstate transport system ATP-binding protein